MAKKERKKERKKRINPLWGVGGGKLGIMPIKKY